LQRVVDAALRGDRRQFQRAGDAFADPVPPVLVDDVAGVGDRPRGHRRDQPVLAGAEPGEVAFEADQRVDLAGVGQGVRVEHRQWHQRVGAGCHAGQEGCGRVRVDEGVDDARAGRCRRFVPVDDVEHTFEYTGDPCPPQERYAGMLP
jgi:hypothetical protein